MVAIRLYQPGDRHRLVRLNPEARRLLANARGEVWIAEADNTVVGYAGLVPVPGLEGITELYAFVARAARRQGIGSQLLQQVLTGATTTGVRQVSYPVANLESETALFLKHHQFSVEHEEWKMEHTLERLPALTVPADGSFITYDRSRAIALFRQLYEQSFAGTPWYQPYLSDAEVAFEWRRGDVMLFLLWSGVPVGFAWLRGNGVGEIEPVGVIRPAQGQGLGRLLLSGALHMLGGGEPLLENNSCRPVPAEKVTLGVWRNNQRAVQLYQTLGFERVSSLYYLAYNLD